VSMSSGTKHSVYYSRDSAGGARLADCRKYLLVESMFDIGLVCFSLLQLVIGLILRMK
jgi:hypothetical protein